MHLPPPRASRKEQQPNDGGREHAKHEGQHDGRLAARKARRVVDRVVRGRVAALTEDTVDASKAWLTRRLCLPRAARVGMLRRVGATAYVAEVAVRTPIAGLEGQAA
eukprot:3677139-Prymnesium_polylepis.2